MKTNTKVLHGYNMIDEHTGASSIPKYQASTFHQDNMFEKQTYTYSRFGNPTQRSLEEAVACLEDGAFCISYASGMAAISSVLLMLKSGDHLIAPNDIYGGAYQLITEILPNYGIEHTFVDMQDCCACEKAIQDNTRLLYLETPSNPLLCVTDIEAMCNLARNHNICVAIDNTFTSPLYQDSFKLGADLVIHSATKFLNGHSDVVAGMVVTNHEDLAKRLRQHQCTFGSVLGIEESWLVLRGIKTLGIRMERSNANAQKIAEYLNAHPKVETVFYPGLKTHPGHAIHMKQSHTGGSVLSFKLKGRPQVKQFVENLRIPLVAVSLGGVESILSYPCTMSHACMSEEDRITHGITCGLLRLSVGIEDIDDLINDIENALAHVED